MTREDAIDFADIAGGLVVVVAYLVWLARGGR